MAEPALVVRVNANLAELQQSLQEGAKNMRVLGEATAGAEAPVNSLRQSFGQVDSVLMASNINVGRYARGLIEIGDMAGKTVSEIGYLATGVSIASAAMAGWKVGRLVAEFFDLDETIGNVTAKLLGFGDVAAEEAGAGADVLALASTRAGRAITDMSEAMVVNTKFVQDRAAALTAQAEAAANAVRPESDLMQAWNASAAAADGFTGSWTNLHEASTIYGDGLPPVTEKTKTLIEVLDEILDVQGPLQEGFKFTSTTVGELGESYDELTEKVKKAKQAEFEHMNQANANAEASAPTLAESGFSMTGSVQQLSDRDVEKMTGQSDSAAQLAFLRQKLASMEHYAETVGTRGGPKITTYAEYQEFASNNYLISQIRAYLEGTAQLPGLATGGNILKGGMAIVGERGPEMVHLPTGARVTPNHAMGGNVTINLTVNGSVVSTHAEFRGLVSEAILGVFRSGGLPLPAVN